LTENSDNSTPSTEKVSTATQPEQQATTTKISEPQHQTSSRPDHFSTNFASFAPDEQQSGADVDKWSTTVASTTAAAEQDRRSSQQTARLDSKGDLLNRSEMESARSSVNRSDSISSNPSFMLDNSEM